jgi:hypothetical protein
MEVCQLGRADLRAPQHVIDGSGGKYVEAHALDAKTAKRTPKAMTGCTLTLDEAAALLDRL